MTEIATAQQMKAAAGTVAAKLLDFHDGLPADEQFVLDFALNRLVAGDEAARGQVTDARGHMIAEERVRPSPEGTGGGGGFPNRFAHNVKVLFEPVAENFPKIWPW